ncbi:MAG: FMN-binding protein [Gemmatimonadota bacterium]
MRRAPIVLGGTVAGLVGVLAFHTTPARLGLPAAAAGAAGAPPAPASRPSAAGTAASPPAGSGAGHAAASRSATGREVNYYYGILSVKVTVAGSRITRVRIGYLDDGGNPRSQFIDQQAIPLLEQQALAAQSASIQGVSGASYTSAGFDQSLQSALHSLGLK